ncbi:hypothetical protein HYC85_024182 [Camellia sinensis]|uniref:Uncharacterized protein n=1 Tax=Camellia sinensis TaxID=4442 RepID=A0A7J7GBN3_CAMSI|nr:hypothetical protein HYC85_024182 [Camellia sinensis]
MGFCHCGSKSAMGGIEGRPLHLAPPSGVCPSMADCGKFSLCAIAFKEEKLDQKMHFDDAHGTYLDFGNHTEKKINGTTTTTTTIFLNTSHMGDEVREAESNIDADEDRTPLRNPKLRKHRSRDHSLIRLLNVDLKVLLGFAIIAFLIVLFMIHRLIIAVEHPQKPRVVTPFPAQRSLIFLR